MIIDKAQVYNECTKKDMEKQIPFIFQVSILFSVFCFSFYFGVVLLVFYFCFCVFERIPMLFEHPFTKKILNRGMLIFSFHEDCVKKCHPWFLHRGFARQWFLTYGDIDFFHYPIPRFILFPLPHTLELLIFSHFLINLISFWLARNNY